MYQTIRLHISEGSASIQIRSMVKKTKIRDLHIKRSLYALRSKTVLSQPSHLTTFRTWSLLFPKCLHGTCWQARGTLIHHWSMGARRKLCPIGLCDSGIYSSGSHAFRVRCSPSNRSPPSRASRVPNHLRHLYINLKRNRFKQNNLSEMFLMSVPHSHNI